MQNKIQVVIAVAANALALAALVGLIVRRRWASCWAFTAYLVTVFVIGSLITVWPSQFYRLDFWLFKESAYGLLKFAIALELAYRTFHAFPGAEATARRVLFSVMVATSLAVFAVSSPNAELAGVAGHVLPRVLNGTVWVFTAIAALILWYRLPVQPLHKAILVGFVPFLLVFTVAMNALNALGWQHQVVTSYGHTVAYVVLVGYWNVAAWQQESSIAAAAHAAK